MSDSAASNAFNDFVDQCESALNNIVETGNDHALFVSGYLHGHFSLVISQAEQVQEYCLNKLDERMRTSLQQAFAQGELEPADQEDVLAMWAELMQGASGTA